MPSNFKDFATFSGCLSSSFGVNTYLFFSRSFLVIMSKESFIRCRYKPYKQLFCMLIWKMWSKEIFSSGLNRKETNSWNLTILRRFVSVMLNFQVDSDVKTNVFEFCLGRFSALSRSFILAVNTSDLVVELWLKDTNWRLLVRKPMEIMVGSQNAKTENG